METIRRGVQRMFVDRQIQQVEVTGSRSVRRHALFAGFTSRLVGRTVRATGRRGKYLLVHLDSPDRLVAHMGMSGQLLSARSDEARPKHTHVVLTFEEGAELRFVDPRTFGEMFITGPAPCGSPVPELAHLGFDPLEDQMSVDRFAQLLGGRRTKLKPLLMDQRFIAGIGNLYADEILFASGLRPDRPSDGLTRPEVAKLQRSMVQTLRSAIEHRGSSLADEQYRDLFGHVGAFQLLHQVYGREGQPCAGCGAPVVRVRGGGRSSFFCRHCQR